jgi:RHH-type proline utilization regulon transcriptional repressor/proline dehydrogenase/delta 1-pyrroline-5-carboxylate dehydrogenase
MNSFIADEAKLAKQLFSKQAFPGADSHALNNLYALIREQEDWFIELLQQYRLNSKEGLLLMSLAEALLRIPDQAGIQSLFNDRIQRGDWYAHSSNKAWNQLFAASLHWLSEHSSNIQHKQNLFEKISQKGAIEICSIFIDQMSNRFVFSEVLSDGLLRSRDLASHESCSFDMLGEAALSYEEAEQYFQSYWQAIEDISQYNHCLDDSAHQLSVKLSALHPRYEAAKIDLLHEQLLPKIKQLCIHAQSHQVHLTFDAEEQYRLEVSLNLLLPLLTDPEFKTLSTGIAVQAYSKSALETIALLSKKIKHTGQTLSIRLVKGAYWDYEIKRAQQLGLKEYPVWTEKQLTDANYLKCAELLLNTQQQNPNQLQAEFATHNPETLLQLEKLRQSLQLPALKLQRLHGMGECQHRYMAENFNTTTRVYCPIGARIRLLPYLVRRLIENGANSSFIYQAHQENGEPFIAKQQAIMQSFEAGNYRIPRPADILAYQNSTSWDLSRNQHFELIAKAAAQHPTEQNLATIYSLHELNINDHFNPQPPASRTFILEAWADEMENSLNLLLPILVREAGKTYQDALDEIREACDFCRYYAKQYCTHFSQPEHCDSITGELNQLTYKGKGLALCISPWNFPLAIFVGQVAAAWVCGNQVIAKPAGQTPLIARAAIQLAYKVGIQASGIKVVEQPGHKLINTFFETHNTLPDLVCFTGSGAAAKAIQTELAQLSDQVIPLIAETGGQNVMIADSSALIDQLVPDVIESAFYSAGQRCSALRVAYIQEEIWQPFCQALKGAMQTLITGPSENRQTDIGPIIDKKAWQKLHEHLSWLEDCAEWVASAPPCQADDANNGHYFSPVAYQIHELDQLKQEHFGPILHLIKYASSDIDKVLHDVAKSRYGLTMGLHSRNQSWIDHIVSHAKVGNLYINRTMTGAKVGSQPFGGHGLSGTGPKAGGPNYLRAMLDEQVISTNTTAWGGNTDLL